MPARNGDGEADAVPVRWSLLGREDEQLLSEWFDGLSARSRQLRFFGPKRELSAADRARLLDLDGWDRLALVATVPGEDGRERVAGIARFVREQAGTAEAELAVAVVDELQGRGIGRRLLRQLACLALRRGISTLVGEVLWENRRMSNLLRRLAPGTRSVGHGGGSHRLHTATAELAGDDCA